MVRRICLLHVSLGILAVLGACGDAGPRSLAAGGDDAGAEDSRAKPEASTDVSTESGIVEGSTADSGLGAEDAAPVLETGVGDSEDDGSSAAQPACGPSPARYTLLTGADSGLVRDNVTMLVWMRDSHGAGEPPQTQASARTYCAGRGMRLPTKDEALALAAAYAACAFGPWGTWTSTAAPTAGYAWVVDYTGGVSPQLNDNFPSAVLCVRDH